MFKFELLVNKAAISATGKDALIWVLLTDVSERGIQIDVFV